MEAQAKVTKLKQKKNVMHFTALAIDKLRPARVERDGKGKITKVWTRKYYDTELRGFYISVGADSKTFYVRGYLGNTDQHIKIGSVDDWSVEKARKRAREIRLQLDDGIDPKAEHRKEKAGAMTLRDALALYMRRDNRLRQSTKEAARALFEYNLADWLDKPMTAITRDMIRARYDEIRERVAERPRGRADYVAKRAKRPTGLSMSTDVMRKFSAVWNYAVDMDNPLGDNPVLALKKKWPPIPRRSVVIPEKSMPDWWAALEEEPDGALKDCVKLVVFTGLRRSEAERLKWEEIDFKNAILRLPRERLKADRALELPLTDVVLDLLKRRHKDRGDSDYVFPTTTIGWAKNKDGTRRKTHPAHISSIEEPCNRIGDRMGLRVTPHDLRRTYTTVAESLEMSGHALNALTNHAPKRDVIGQHYLVLNADRLREPAQRVADRLQQLIRKPSKTA